MNFKTYPVEGSNLTEAMVREAIEDLRRAPIRVCGVTQPHVLYPGQLTREGWHACGTCGMPVWVSV